MPLSIVLRLDSRMETPEPALSPTEWEVMKTLWDHGPMAARDVFAALPADAEGAPVPDDLRVIVVGQENLKDGGRVRLQDTAY